MQSNSLLLAVRSQQAEEGQLPDRAVTRPRRGPPGSLRDPSSQSSGSSGSSDRDSSPLRSNSPAAPVSAAAATPSHTPVPSGGKRTRVTFADIVRSVPDVAAEHDQAVPDLRADTLPATERYPAGWPA